MSYINKPGCAEYVDNLYDTSREIRHVLVNAGTPQTGKLRLSIPVACHFYLASKVYLVERDSRYILR